MFATELRKNSMTKCWRGKSAISNDGQNVMMMVFSSRQFALMAKRTYDKLNIGFDIKFQEFYISVAFVWTSLDKGYLGMECLEAISMCKWNAVMRVWFCEKWEIRVLLFCQFYEIHIFRRYHFKYNPISHFTKYDTNHHIDSRTWNSIPQKFN